MMAYWICVACGVQHAATENPPEHCEICEDERQYVGHDGQRWTTLDELITTSHHTVIRELEPGLTGIGVEPQFGIGQRALLVQTPAGNLLWDPPGFLDDSAIQQVWSLGGLAAVAASHPHFYGVQSEWSAAFDRAPVWVPEADRSWVRRPGNEVRSWRDQAEVLPGVTLIQCGGHFDGSSVVHWRDGAEGSGALLVGDTITVVMDRQFVSFMRSYPNHIPLPEAAVRRMVAAVAPYAWDRIYGGWWSRVIQSGAHEAVEQSAQRYIGWLSGENWREEHR